MWLFESLPWPIVVLFTLALLITLVSLGWAVVLYWKGSRARRFAPEPSLQAADEYLWVAMVPALNEQVTIQDSVNRLTELQARNRIILVIDDGSDDATPSILNKMAFEDLEVLRRDLPNARVGKAAALNDAYQHLTHNILGTGGRFAGWPRDKVIVVIVDADGRLDPSSPAFVAPHFQDSTLGGAQVEVRIYNRSHPLAWFQDAEFGLFGRLYQQGRAGWGTSGMGGNGQFNRLAALDTVVDGGPGPWRDTLTEDQDLGLRLIGAGWHGTQETRTAVDQQGVSSLPRLYRQRTRWAQGNLQALRHAGTVARADLSVTAKADLLYALVLPLLQMVVGMSSLVAIGLLLSGVSLVPEGTMTWALLAFAIALGLGGVLIGCLARARGTGWTGHLMALATAVPYALYAWLMWPVLIKAAWRQVRGATSWAKTEREPLGATREIQVATTR